MFQVYCANCWFEATIDIVLHGNAMEIYLEHLQFEDR